MKKSALIALAGTTLAAVSAAQAQVYGGPSGVAIPDLSEGAASIVVSGGPAAITDLNVVVQIAHTWDADVDMALVGPGGAKHIILSTDNGGSADNYSTTRFDDSGAPITGGTAPFNGNFAPQGPSGDYNGLALPGAGQASLAGFNGDNSNGTWQLIAADDEGGIAGTIVYASLELNGAVDPNGNQPSNPQIVDGIYNPFPVPNNGVVTFTVDVEPGINPISTGIVVTADLSGLGGSATQNFFDNGTNGDVTAGDLTYSYAHTVSGLTQASLVEVEVNISDAQFRAGDPVYFNVAVAQIPTTFTDLGNINCSESLNSGTVAPGGVTWFKMDIPNVIDDPEYYVDMWINSTSGLADSEMGLFDNTGVLVAIDDDSGNGFLSLLTFGSTVVRDNPDDMNFPPDGFNGELTAGTYWLAVAGYNALFADGWVVDTNDIDGGTIDLRINASTPGCSGNPDGEGADVLVGACGGTALLTVSVTGGNNPPSTGLGVSINLSALGGSATQAMFDNGTNGDVTAGDNVFSYAVSVAGGGDATFALPFTVTDAQSRTGTGSLDVVRSGAEVGDLPSSAKTYYGLNTPATTLGGTLAANDVDMFAICVADTTNFEASVNNGGASFDTQLFLFNADGAGAAMNDDEPDAAQTLQSHLMISNSINTSAPPIVLSSGGLYYLAIAQYDVDPITSGSAADTIWADQGGTPLTYDVTWAPNGTTPTAPVVGWAGAGNTGGAFTITLTGAGTVCPADLSNTNLTASPDCAVDINDLLFFLTAFEAGNADIADVSVTGNPDCATDINDLLFFLSSFEGGC